jgi:hypothetical protein
MDDAARRTTARILLWVAGAAALVFVLTFLVEFWTCSGGGPGGCGYSYVPNLTGILLRALAFLVAIAAWVASILVRRPLRQT